MATLLEENQRLRAQWKSCEHRWKCAELQVEELQRRAQQAEAAARQKEEQWIAEFDRSVQALLQIIQHHEDEKKQLQTEVEWLRAEAATAATAVVVPPQITKMARSTQTEKPPRRNSVRFAKEENEMTEKAVDTATIDRLARMQQLFEQLHLPRGHCSGKSGDPTNSADKRGEVRDSVERESSTSTSCDLKAAILARWRTIRPEDGASKVGFSVAAVGSGSKTSETQTEEAPILETPPTALQQDLQERNRLLHERLTSQQNVLDKFLHSKLKHASSREDQHKEKLKVDLLTPTPLSPGSHVQTADERFEPPQRRPLSPPAA